MVSVTQAWLDASIPRARRGPLGVDLVDVERLRATLERAPGLAERLFTESERAYCSARRDPVRHLAGTLAAKEAVIKALELGSLASWARRIEVARNDSGAPRARVGNHSVPVSISHDGGWAVAVAVSA